MASKRSQIAMTPDEIGAYLAANRFAILVTNGHDGFPQPLPMHYVWRDGCLLMTSFRKTQKVVNLRRDPRCSLLVETGNEHYEQIRSVIAHANAEIVDDFATTRQVMLWGMEASLSAPQTPAARDAVVTAQAPKRVTLRFAPHRYVSWDHSKLGGQY